MTRINRVSIQGFKSFAHKTDIVFSNKFNCILGPNGSGKSNIGDALCFVLGRLSAKSMRAEKASNLIFNGAKDKKPASLGMVEIEFSNESKIFPLETPEVVINRTITKDGTSIYRINGKKKTRSEIVDLLGMSRINPDGYNIILQGDITRFVTMSPLERRKIIEEISDVAVYEERKHKATLELTKVEEKLNSAEIILTERKTHLKELKKDRDQALKFKELKNRIDSNKATFLYSQIEEREKERSQFDSEVSKHQEKISKSEEKIVKMKEEIAQKKEKIAKINSEIEQKGEKEQLKVHRDIEDIKVDIAKEKTRVSTLKDEINKIRQRRDQFRQELKELEDKTSSYSKNQSEQQNLLLRRQKEQEQIEKSIAEFRKKHKIESSNEIESEIESKDKLIEQKQEDIQKIRLSQQELLREKDKLEYQLESIDERIRKVKEVEQENKEQVKKLQQLKANFKNATLRLNKLLEQDSSFAAQLANARRSLVELQEKQAKLNAKTLSIEAGLASNNALKAILDNRSRFKGVHGTIAELGQVKKDYALSLETAASNKMNHIVVDSDDTAAECIKYLKNNKLGTASFIPLNKIKSLPITADDKSLLKKKGAIDFAINLISYSSKYEKAFSYVFGNTLIVEDIDIAKSIGVGRIKMATLDGNAVEISGVMKGGFITRKASLGFKEKDTAEELEKVESELGQQQSIISNIEDKRLANEQEISSLRNLKGEMEAEIITLEKTLHLETSDLEASSDLKKEICSRLKEIETSLEGIQKSINSINHELAEAKTLKQNLRAKVNELRDPKLLAQLSAFEESKQKCREDILRLESDLKNSRSQVDQLLSPEKEKILGILKQHDKEEISFDKEIKDLSQSVQKKEKDLQVKENESKEFYSKYKELFNIREKINSDINAAENNIESIRDSSRTSERELNLVSLKNAEIKAKMAALQEEMARYKDVPILKNKDPAELKQEINKFEVMLAQMSAVNMKALEIYEQVETEYNKLVEKKDSLIKEKTDVLTLMNEIETKKKENFMKTFNQANENFQRIFSNLFKKGKAYLELENPDNIFEDGLNIMVKLTGNRYLDLKSLSGGEKTLTALSFIFAIQEYQPASFYILDEIDAALDKHNSETLAKLIGNYSHNAQYIVISHNDSLISEADTLFGISMNEGVSKVTSLKI
jgi:chromosome segregation protein